MEGKYHVQQATFDKEEVTVEVPEAQCHMQQELCARVVSVHALCMSDSVGYIYSMYSYNFAL